MDHPTFESLDEMAAATAGALAQAAAGSAFHLFQEKQFRRLARFKQLSQVEHDRIFNELVLAGLTVAMLTLEAPDLRVQADMRPFLTSVSKAIPRAYVELLRSHGVEAEHLRDWETLIPSRYEEYAGDRHKVRAAAMQTEADAGTFDRESLTQIQLLVPVCAVVIGCHHHICRSETDGRDDLFKHTLHWLAKYYIELRVRFEGGTITPLDRVQVALKRLLRRLRPDR